MKKKEFKLIMIKKNKDIYFDKNNHNYFIKAVCVSDLVNTKYPFDKNSIPEDILKNAIKRGNCIHNALEHYYKTKESKNCSCDENYYTHNMQIKNGISLLNNLLKDIKGDIEIVSEKADYYYYNNLLIAGTIDILIYVNKSLYAILDWKTTKDIHLEKYSLQLAFYNLITTKQKLIIPKLFIANVNQNKLIEAQNINLSELKKIIEEYKKQN